jgi:hypothetical protein
VCALAENHDAEFQATLETGVILITAIKVHDVYNGEA